MSNQESFDGGEDILPDTHGCETCKHFYKPVWEFCYKCNGEDYWEARR